MCLRMILFMVVNEQDEDSFFYGATYLDIKRSDDLVSDSNHGQ